MEQNINSSMLGDRITCDFYFLFIIFLYYLNYLKWVFISFVEKIFKKIIKGKRAVFLKSISWMQILPSPDPAFSTLSGDRGDRKT